MSQHLMPCSTQLDFSANSYKTSPFYTVMTKRKMETTVENNDEKIQKFGSHSIAPENTKELKKQKSNRKG